MLMDWAVIAVSITGAVALMAMTLLGVRLLAHVRRPAGGRDMEGFSLARYEPMLRLLRDDDLEFLAAQPGYKPEIGKKLRADRRRIFRLYLTELVSDFRRLHATARLAVADSPAENSKLVGVLMRQEVTFWTALAIVEARLMLPGVQVDVRGFVETVEAMRVDLARLNAPAAA
jgi:hypothetical protein